MFKHLSTMTLSSVSDGSDSNADTPVSGPQDDTTDVDNISGGAATNQDIEPVEPPVDDTDIPLDVPLDDPEDLTDPDEDDEIIEIIADSDDIDESADALSSASETLHALSVSVEKFGPSKAAMDFVSKLGVFDAATQTMIANESMSDDDGFYASTMTIAQEGLKDRAAALVSKAGEGIAKLSTKALAVGVSFKDKMKEWSSSGKEWVSKHPVASIFAGVAAIASVAGVIAFATGRISSPTLVKEGIPDLYAKIKSMVTSIKFPWTKVTPKPDPNVLLLTYEPYVDPFGGAISSAGTPFSEAVQARTWTGPKMMDLAAKLDTALSKIRAALGSFGKAIVQIGKDLVRPGKMHEEVASNVSKAMQKAYANKTSMSAGAIMNAAWRTIAVSAIYAMAARLVVEGVFRGIKWMEQRGDAKIEAVANS